MKQFMNTHSTCVLINATPFQPLSVPMITAFAKTMTQTHTKRLSHKKGKEISPVILFQIF